MRHRNISGPLFSAHFVIVWKILSTNFMIHRILINAFLLFILPFVCLPVNLIFALMYAATLTGCLSFQWIMYACMWHMRACSWAERNEKNETKKKTFIMNLPTVDTLIHNFIGIFTTLKCSLPNLILSPSSSLFDCVFSFFRCSFHLSTLLRTLTWKRLFLSLAKMISRVKSLGICFVRYYFFYRWWLNKRTRAHNNKKKLL